MNLYRRSLADLARGVAVTAVNAAARLADRAITAWPNTTHEPRIPTQRDRQTQRTTAVRAAADQWEREYPVLPEAWLQLITQEAND